MIRWPSRSLPGLRKLFEPLQELDVYVEDAGDEPFYKSLLRYATGGGVPIARVFGLGGRSAVIQRAMNHDFASRKALFIIDGDLEWVRGDPQPPGFALHRHSAYCIENLLLCEVAVVKVLSEEAATDPDDARSTLEYCEWLRSVSDPLVALFAAYATLNQVDPETKTVAEGVGRLCKPRGRRTELDANKVAAEVRSVLEKAAAVVGDRTASSAYAQTYQRLLSLRDPSLAVSGKDYMLPLLEFRLNSLNCRVKRRALRMRLASAGDPGRFSALASAVRAAARRSISRRSPSASR